MQLQKHADRTGDVVKELASADRFFGYAQTRAYSFLVTNILKISQEVKMGFIKKVIIMALVAGALYFVYKEMFEPILKSGQGRVGNFYGNVPTPNIE